MEDDSQPSLPRIFLDRIAACTRRLCPHRHQPRRSGVNIGAVCEEAPKVVLTKGVQERPLIVTNWLCAQRGPTPTTQHAAGGVPPLCVLPQDVWIGIACHTRESLPRTTRLRTSGGTSTAPTSEPPLDAGEQARARPRAACAAGAFTQRVRWTVAAASLPSLRPHLLCRAPRRARASLHCDAVKTGLRLT